MSLNVADLASNLKSLDLRMTALEKQVLAESRDEIGKQLENLSTKFKHNQEQLKLLESAVLEMYRGGPGKGSPKLTSPVTPKSRSSQSPLREEGGIEMTKLSISGQRYQQADSERYSDSMHSSASMKISSTASFAAISSFASNLKFKHEESPLPQSSYEAIIFFPQESQKAGITIIASIVLSFMLQFVLLNSFMIMNDSKKDSVLPEDARVWRNGAGHRLDHMSVLSGSSLVSRVCSGDASVHMSTNIMDLVDTSRAYLLSGSASSFWWPIPFGGMLSMVIVTAWSMQAGQDLASIFNYFSCLLTLPSGDTLVEQDPDDDEKMYIVSIGRAMRIVALVACCVHMVVESFAWYLGCVYIVRTIEVENMVINGLGSAVMISVDKVVFDTLLADQVRKHCGQARFQGFRGTFANKIFFMSIMPVVMILMEVRPMCFGMAEYLQEACGGNQNFVVGQGARTGIFVAAPSPEPQSNKEWSAPDDSQPDPSGRNHFKYIIKDAVDSIDQSKTAIFWEPSIRNLKLFLSTDLVSFRNTIDPLCYDMELLELPTPFLTSLKFQVGVPDATSCDAFGEIMIQNVPVCHKKANRLLRTLCPRTCGCDDPGSGLVYMQSCPNSCAPKRAIKAQTHKLLQHVGGLPCSNFLPEVLAKHVEWQRYVKSVRFMWNQSFHGFRSFQTGIKTYLPSLANGNCPAPGTRGVWDITRTFCSLSNFAFWCPESCKCNVDCKGDERWRCNPDCNPVCRE